MGKALLKLAGPFFLCDIRRSANRPGGQAEMGALDGKVAIITGGTSGIGARTAELFVQEGAKVVIAGRRQTEGECLAKQLGAAAVFLRTDVTREADIKALI